MLSKEQIRPGVLIKCTIQGRKVKKAAIQVEDDRVFICQDVKDGSNCQDKLGFHFSWVTAKLSDVGRIYADTDQLFATQGVARVELLVQDWDEEQNTL